MKILPIIIIAIALAGIVGWGMNVVALASSDFEKPYKHEVLRAVGLIPPVGAVMGYIPIEDGDNHPAE